MAIKGTYIPQEVDLNSEVDNTTIEYSDGKLKVKNNGITESKLASNSVTENKIDNNAVTTDKIADEAVTKDKLANSALYSYRLYASSAIGTPDSNHISGQEYSGNKILNFTGVISKVKFYLYKGGSPTGVAYIRVRDASDNSILGETTFYPSSLSSSPREETFTFSSPVIVNNKDIIISIEYPDGDFSKYIRAKHSANDEYSDVIGVYSSNGGSSWNNYGNPELWFELWEQFYAISH